MSVTRQYGREDVDYSTWYSEWSRLLAKRLTRPELEKRLGVVSTELGRATQSHLGAIQASASMTGCSQRRAQTGNVVAAAGEERLALSGALEIHELFPEHAKAVTS